MLNFETVQASLAVTAIWAALLGLLVVGLAGNISYLRLTRKVSLGDHGDRYLNRAIRAHANAVEFVPLALVLLFSYSLLGGSIVMIHVTAAALLLGRILHAWGMLAKATTVRRQVGALLSSLVLLALVILNLIAACALL